MEWNGRIEDILKTLRQAYWHRLFTWLGFMGNGTRPYRFSESGPLSVLRTKICYLSIPSVGILTREMLTTWHVSGFKYEESWLDVRISWLKTILNPLWNLFFSLSFPRHVRVPAPATTSRASAAAPARKRRPSTTSTTEPRTPTPTMTKTNRWTRKAPSKSSSRPSRGRFGGRAFEDRKKAGTKRLVVPIKKFSTSLQSDHSTQSTDKVVNKFALSAMKKVLTSNVLNLKTVLGAAAMGEMKNWDQDFNSTPIPTCCRDREAKTITIEKWNWVKSRKIVENLHSPRFLG